VSVEPTGYIFDGWGASLAWWAEVMGGAGWPAQSRSDVINLLFAPASGNPSQRKGLGLTIMRYNLGAEPVPPSSDAGCPAMRAGAAVPSIGVPPPPEERFDLSNDPAQIDILRMASTVVGNAAHLEMFANSPPVWLTNSHCASGAADGRNNNLRTADVGGQPQTGVVAYARYLVGAVRAFGSSGVRFDTLEPFNEPDASWWSLSCNPCQEGAHIDPDTQAAVIAALCEDLADLRNATGYAPALAVSDENSVDDTLKVLPKLLAADGRCVQQINVHGYSGQQSYSGGARGQLRRAASGRRMWMSEYGTGLGAVELAMQIVHDLTDLQPSAWVYWQPVEDQWGLINRRIDDPIPAGGTPELTSRFFSLEQFSQFIRPGFTILDVHDSTHDAAHPTSDRRATAAARSPDQNTVVVVVANRDDGDPYNVDLSRVAPGSGWQVRRYRTPDNGQLADAGTTQLAGGRLADDPTPNAVTTYVLTRGAPTGSGSASPSSKRVTTIRGQLDPTPPIGHHTVDVLVTTEANPNGDPTAGGTAVVLMGPPSCWPPGPDPSSCGAPGQSPDPSSYHELARGAVQAGHATISLPAGDPGLDTIIVRYLGDATHCANTTEIYSQRHPSGPATSSPSPPCS
jgi:hypothetical protein